MRLTPATLLVLAKSFLGVHGADNQTEEETIVVVDHRLGMAAVPRTSAGGPLVRMEPDVMLHNSSTSSWLKASRVPDGELVSLIVAVRVDEDRRAELERIFWEVSDPDHQKYGKHLTVDEITKVLAVPIDRVKRISDYFLSAGATNALASPNNDVITVTMPAATIEATLSTTLHFFTHKEHTNARRIVRSSTGYSLPAEVAKDVILVGELLQFPLIHHVPVPAKSSDDLVDTWPDSCGGACHGLVTPAVLSERYKVPDSSAANPSGNGMAVAEFQNQWYLDSDLATFSQTCHRHVTVDKLVGRNRPQPGTESELDIEYIKAVAPSVPLTVVFDDQYSLLSWANQITSMEDSPSVHSLSYGNDERQQSGVDYMYACNTAFMKAGARGLSLLAASGDQGVCGREGCGRLKFRFKPDFPGGSPYVTIVGGTDFETAGVVGAESAWINGGGGFSDNFAAPDYQKAAIAAYMASPDANLPPQAYWNATGRGYPDVAALGGVKNAYCIHVGGRWGGVGGTSAATPVVAGIFARLNGLRVAKGKPPLGFLNPFIYKNPSGFQDVTSGINKATRNYGFTAVKGWDAATGHGTPDFEKLSQLVMGGHADTSIVV